MPSPPLSLPDAPVLRVDGVGLRVVPPTGDGELLVLVHGGWSDHATWNALVPHLERSFRVVRYDRRGHTGSERGAGIRTRRQDEDDLAAIIEAQDAGPAHLLGTSYGAAISLALAGRRPELVRSVVAHEPVVLDVVPDAAARAFMEGVARQIAGGDIAGGAKRFFEEGALGPGGWELVPEPVQNAAMANAHTYIDMLLAPDWAALDVPAVARFAGPLLITYGDRSPEWLSGGAVGVAERIGCRRMLIPGARHTPHHTHPDALAAVLEGLVGARDRRLAA
jgi:pimeloyl-ACP methyl ester carboxylesterase